jgi:hypothetical protein
MPPQSGSFATDAHVLPCGDEGDGVCAIAACALASAASAPHVSVDIENETERLINIPLPNGRDSTVPARTVRITAEAFVYTSPAPPFTLGRA